MEKFRNFITVNFNKISSVREKYRSYVSPKNIKIAISSILFFGLIASVILIGQSQDIRGRAKEADKKADTKKITWDEVKLSAKVENKPIVSTKLNYKLPLGASQILPVTGYWQGKTVKVVPNDRFPPEFNDGNHESVKSIQSMPDSRLFFGNYNIFGIRDQDDSNWERLNFFQLNFGVNGSTWITFFTPTLQTPYEVYFGDDYTSSGRIVRMMTDGRFELVADPWEPNFGYLKDVRITPYKSNHGMFAYRSSVLKGEIYYLQQGTIRKWYTPTQICYNGTWADTIDTMLTDPYDSHEVYGFVSEANCGQYTQYLYHFDFDNNNQLIMERLGKINGGVSEFRKTFFSKRYDDPNQKMVYGGVGTAGGNYYMMVIPYFKTDGTELQAEWYRIDNETYPDFVNSTVQVKPGGETDHIWYVASEVRGIYLGRNFDNSNLGYFIRTEDTSILANPYINDVAHDQFLNIYSGHKQLANQFHDASVTVLEGPVNTPTPTPTLTPTPTIIPSPTPTPTPNPINTPPKIITDKLKKGMVNSSYRASVVGSDIDSQDELSMQIRNLPQGLKQGICQNFQADRRKIIVCEIVGRPQNAGQFSVLVELNDNHGGRQLKTLLLVIVPDNEEGYRALIY